MSRSVVHSPGDLFSRPRQVDEQNGLFNFRADPVTISPLKCRAANNRGFLAMGESIAYPVKPRPAIGVVEWRSGAHLGDVLWCMQIVAVDVGCVQRLGERGAHCGFTAA